MRHGETDWNAEGRIQGQRDTPLNARGRAQARRCGEILRDLFAREATAPLAYAYVASPLVRATETMQIARGVLGLAPDAFTTDARLKELYFGAWEGFTIPELRGQGEAALVAGRERDKWGFTPPGGESYAMLRERIAAWHAGVAQPTVVAAHGGVLRALWQVLDIASAREAPNINVDQGVVYALAPGAMDVLR